MKLRTKRNTECKVSDKSGIGTTAQESVAGATRGRGGGRLRGERREINAPHVNR